MRAVRDEPVDPAWVEATLDRLERFVQTGDESNLAEAVVEIVNEPGGEAAKIY
jgi:hypothetical protein